jgi:tetratricopeptide (TPR) repeat protein
VERCKLTLDLASSLLTKGDVEAGQQLCRDAFAIARALNDAHLMAEAALTYGSVIVVAKVDRELVAMLQESLERLPPKATAARARISARLAAAMQPAPNPAEPMAMAYEAIALARTTGDERVLYDVLKSAISALMDFASADERVPLNQEVESLARRFGDIPGEFRSNLRLMIDAGELGDRRMMDDIIDACERIANRIKLPHYQWRAASARAMQAMIEGYFDKASEYLDQAERLAEEAGDVSAHLTVPIQRFVILYEWDSPRATPFEVIERQLSEVFATLPDAEIYARPVFASYFCRSGRTDTGRSITDEHLVERIFAGGDRFCVARLGEVAARQGDLALTRRVLEQLRPYETRCATMGLMGSHWAGPVALTMGLLCTTLERYDEAERHLATALEIARRMRAQPMLARIYEAMSQLAERVGDNATAQRYAAESSAIAQRLHLRPTHVAPGDTVTPVETVHAIAESFSMNLEGDVWTVRFGERSALVRDSKGLRMLARLIRQPDRDIHVLDLSGTGAAIADSGDAGPVLDAQARRQYQERVRELQEELEEADELNDQGRADAIRDELDFIARELSRAFGLGGRERTSGSAAERARINVRRRIKDALQRVDEQLPGAGRYLENTIKTGSYCRYSPM